MKKNVVVNVNLKGGLLYFFSSPRNVIARTLETYNDQGYKFVYALPPNTNPLFLIIQILVLLCTFGIYTPMPSYMMVFEKDVK